TSPLPIGKRVPGGTLSVSSPGIRPSSQTDRARASDVPAPWTSSHTSRLSPIRAYVAYGVRRVSFSSRYGNIRQRLRTRSVDGSGMVDWRNQVEYTSRDATSPGAPPRFLSSTPAAGLDRRALFASRDRELDAPARRLGRRRGRHARR